LPYADPGLWGGWIRKENPESQKVLCKRVRERVWLSRRNLPVIGCRTGRFSFFIRIDNLNRGGIVQGS